VFKALRKAMSNETPRRLLRLVDNPPTAVAADELPRPEVRVGQIWIARPDEGPDVLVLLIEVRDDHVDALLCSDDDGLATETDAVLEPPDTGWPDRLLVHGDVGGPILRKRLVGSPGRIDPGIVRRIVLRGRGVDFYSHDLGRGTPILSESDPRWDAKLERVEQLRTVKARATELGLKLYRLTR
jgi:hypothetical protein